MRHMQVENIAFDGNKNGVNKLITAPTAIFIAGMQPHATFKELNGVY